MGINAEYMGNHKKAMVKFLKDGKIVVLLQGRYAGKKAVILKTMDDNTKERPYGHCVVVGVAKTPLPITRAMCKPTPKMKKLVKALHHQAIRQDGQLHPRYANQVQRRELHVQGAQGCPLRRHLLRGCRQE